MDSTKSEHTQLAEHTSSLKRRVPRDCTLCRLRRKFRTLLVAEWRTPAPVLPCPYGLPVSQAVGIHIFTFEACSSFTRVTACKLLTHLSWLYREASP